MVSSSHICAKEQERKDLWALHPLKVESTGSPWPELENHEAPEQMRLSTSEYDSVKGRKGLLGSVLEGGSECDSLK